MQFAAQAVVWFVAQVGDGAEAGRAPERRDSPTSHCAADLQERTAEVAQRIERSCNRVPRTCGYT